EQPWNPAVLEQRIGRIYRLGQKLPIDVYNLVSEGSIESRIAGIVGSKSVLFKGVFDGTTNEVRFDGEASFAAEVRKLLDLTLPEAPEVKATQLSDLDDSPEDADSEIADIPDADSTSDAVSDSPTAETPTLAMQVLDDSVGANLHDLPRLEQMHPPPQHKLLGPENLQRLFEQLRITSTEDGSLRIEAPRETALTLATVLESLGKLLRIGAP
ncbi:MAG TPA: hypothetical protein VIV60_06920, partial [Polyangiaceae bacterium]